MKGKQKGGLRGRRQKICWVVAAVHALKPHTQEAGAGESLSLRSALSTEWIPGQPQREPFLNKTKQTKQHHQQQQNDK